MENISGFSPERNSNVAMMDHRTATSNTATKDEIEGFRKRIRLLCGIVIVLVIAVVVLIIVLGVTASHRPPPIENEVDTSQFD